MRSKSRSHETFSPSLYLPWHGNIGRHLPSEEAVVDCRCGTLRFPLFYGYTRVTKAWDQMEIILPAGVLLTKSILTI